MNTATKQTKESIEQLKQNCLALGEKHEGEQMLIAVCAPRFNRGVRKAVCEIALQQTCVKCGNVQNFVNWADPTNLRDLERYKRADVVLNTVIGGSGVLPTVKNAPYFWDTENIKSRGKNVQTF